MQRRNSQRKPGTTRWSPRRRAVGGTARASRINRAAAKSRCAGEWGGWGRLSDDGPGHYNPDRSEGPIADRESPHDANALALSPTATTIQAANLATRVERF